MENRIDIRQEIKKEISYMLGSIEECEMLAEMGIFKKLGWEYQPGSFFDATDDEINAVIEIMEL